MKDKRQRIAVAWPYAAVYADPNFAASLLQAAANSIGMPYYAPNPMISSTQNPYTYGYRYSPYHRDPSNNSHTSSISTQLNGQIYTRGDLRNNSVCSIPLSSIDESEKVLILNFSQIVSSKM